MKKPLHHHLQDYFFPHSRNNYRPNLFSVTSVAVLVLAVIIFEVGYLVQTKIVFLKTDFLASVLPGALVSLTNQDRALIGLSGVSEDNLLNKAAQSAAEDMATNGYFAHVSPDGKTPWYWLDSVGYQYSYAGENLAVNFTDSSNVETAWMNSPTHRANIEKPQYTKVGIGVANGIYEGKETTFVVQFFATPIASAKNQTLESNTIPENLLSIEYESVSTTSSEVLGVQTQLDAPAGISKVKNLLAFIGTSPMLVITYILSVFAVVILLLLIIAIIARMRSQYVEVIGGGLILLLIIIGFLLFNIKNLDEVKILSRGQTEISTRYLQK